MNFTHRCGIDSAAFVYFREGAELHMHGLYFQHAFISRLKNAVIDFSFSLLIHFSTIPDFKEDETAVAMERLQLTSAL
jgi:hypothetical protein